MCGDGWIARYRANYNLILKIGTVLAGPLYESITIISKEANTLLLPDRVNLFAIDPCHASECQQKYSSIS